MSSTTYTNRLASINNAPLGWNALGVVPDGKLWVVRDVIAYLSAPNTTKSFNGSVLKGNSRTVTLLGIGPPNVWEQFTYHYEMRQVLNAGEDLQVFAGDTGWCWSVSGYVFTSP